VPATKPPFIVLENVVRGDNHAQNSNNTHGLHVLSLAENKPLKLGRGHESDVRIPDVSISRCHATISFSNGEFLLEDRASKFGTLIAVKKPRCLHGEQVKFQVGRSVMTFRTDTGPASVAETCAEALVGSLD
jgi:hypothetical protein